jgi:transposase InsO family protein
MRAHGILGYRPRRRRSPTKPDQAAPPAPDLLGRLFDPDRLDVAWCGGVAYVPTDQGWLYLASVMDLASRRLLGYAMGERHDAALAVRALEAAVATRGQRRMDGTIFHTDRGSEYAATATVEACQRLGLTQSMSRTGSCLDNAAAESWFASLKVELVGRTRYHTHAEARAAIFAWIAYYNASRLHSARQYLPPLEWEHRRAPYRPATLDHGRIAPVSSPAGEVHLTQGGRHPAVGQRRVAGAAPPWPVDPGQALWAGGRLRGSAGQTVARLGARQSFIRVGRPQTMRVDCGGRRPSRPGCPGSRRS